MTATTGFAHTTNGRGAPSLYLEGDVSGSDVLEFARAHGVQMVDFKFTDLPST
jgi:hypothetical protein